VRPMMCRKGQSQLRAGALSARRSAVTSNAWQLLAGAEPGDRGGGLTILPVAHCELAVQSWAAPAAGHEARHEDPVSGPRPRPQPTTEATSVATRLVKEAVQAPLDACLRRLLVDVELDVVGRDAEGCPCHLREARRVTSRPCRGRKIVAVFLDADDHRVCSRLGRRGDEDNGWLGVDRRTHETISSFIGNLYRSRPSRGHLSAGRHGLEDPAPLSRRLAVDAIVLSSGRTVVGGFA
jgi:hypothetical protein